MIKPGMIGATTRLHAVLLAVLCLPVLATGVAAPRAEGATAYLNLNYDIDSPPAPAPATQNHLDLYTPPGPTAGKRRPLVVYVHGGGWAIGDKANKIASKIALFTGAGYVFASVNYRLSPSSGDPESDPGRIRFPAHPHDVGEAIGWLSRRGRKYGFDPKRILLIGHSAGGHLVSLVSTDPRYVRSYGVKAWQLIGTVSLDSDAYDVPNRIATGTPMARSILYNAFATPAENQIDDAWIRGSPIHWAGKGDPAMLLVTQAANPSRRAEAERMATALSRGSVGSVLAVPYNHEQINDMVGSPADTAGETARIMGFFARRAAEAKEPRVKLRRHPRRRSLARGRLTAVRFAFRSNLKRARFRCALDRRRLRPCRSPRRFRLRAGRHRFRVQAISPRGRPGPVRVFRFRIVRSR